MLLIGRYRSITALHSGLAVSLILSQPIANAAEANADVIYMQTCYVCHGDDGSGNMPGVPDLSESKTLFVDNEKDIVTRLKTGISKPGNISMPASGGNPDLTDKQLLEVLRYTKKLVNNNPSAFQK